MKRKASDAAEGKQKKIKLVATMSLQAFQNAYWYATELKEFASEIGIPGAAGMRKDILEKHIETFLQTGKAPNVKAQASRDGPKDCEGVIRRSTPILNYTSNPKTKAFLEAEAKKAGAVKKSGDRYWLNRWREKQLEAGKTITYGDLADELIRMRNKPGRLPQIPSTKYNNFITDYLADNPGSSKAKAQAQWDRLKGADTPKTYAGYVKLFGKKKGGQTHEKSAGASMHPA